MLETQDNPLAPPTDQPEVETPKDDPRKKLLESFRNSIAICKQYRRKLITNWVVSIDYRRGKPFSSQTDSDRVVVNMDWSLTKAKQAALFSQIPQVHLNHPPQTLSAPWVFAFQQRLNDTLIAAGIETALDEVLPDCINAAGIGGVICAHEAITEEVEVPAIDFAMLPPQVAQQIQQTGMMPDGTPVPTIKVPRTLDHRYTIQRISPADLLWPINFTGSDFDNAPWIGRSGRLPWAQAQALFKLSSEDKGKYAVDTEDRSLQDRLSHDIDKDRIQTEDTVNFDEVFYKNYHFDVDAKSFSTIHHLVFLAGKEEPVVDEQWKGQRLDEQAGELIGSIKYPIRLLTLTYVTDETIPPSDSAIGRPQVDELNKSRTQMILQRERSLPIRWFDVNRVDTLIQQYLMKGTWQGMIPVQGQGTNIIGEVARAQFPQEDFTFDSIAKQDLQDNWQMGSNQTGNYAPKRTSATEANVVQENYNTRIGRERAKVSKFFVSISEVVGGLLSLYEDAQSFGEGFNPGVSKSLSYSIQADSTVLLDSNQRLDKLTRFLNLTAKSGYVNVETVIKEMAVLSGLDPAVVVKAPEPAPPAEPSISLRLSGVEDLLNPLTLAFLMKSGQAPPPELIEQAKKLIETALTPPPPPMPPSPGMPGMPGAPGLSLTPSGMPPGPQTPPSPPPPEVGAANPDWGINPQISERTEEV